jgi:glycosyltransferase involved in cell wall biosynthesis
MTKSKPRAKSSPERPLRILFLHPDLGIGGAERLILDAALGLQSLGHSITIYTSHCDPNHCFDEARDGTLAVKVAGNSIVPASVLGGFKILCAILRQFHLLLYLYFSGTLASLNPDIVVMDQLSAGLGVLRLLAPDVRSLFYIHFPDKLLASREGVLRAAYRIPFDAFEGLTTGLADGLVVNSKFTRGVVQGAFTELRGRDLRVVYPCVDARDTGKMEVETLWGGMKVVVSVNRFERKKGVELAIKAFAGLKPEERKGVRLVLAGKNSLLYQNRRNSKSDRWLRHQSPRERRVPPRARIPRREPQPKDNHHQNHCYSPRRPLRHPSPVPPLRACPSQSLSPPHRPPPPLHARQRAFRNRSPRSHAGRDSCTSRRFRRAFRDGHRQRDGLATTRRRHRSLDEDHEIRPVGAERQSIAANRSPGSRAGEGAVLVGENGTRSRGRGGGSGAEAKKRWHASVVDSDGITAAGPVCGHKGSYLGISELVFVNK